MVYHNRHIKMTSATYETCIAAFTVKTRLVVVLVWNRELSRDTLVYKDYFHEVCPERTHQRLWENRVTSEDFYSPKRRLCRRIECPS